ncbi:unnamed protein product [Oncorhynchus mykiss]|uniref:Par3/HAL N-terminal domain-containing protein n=1 Tax=Oncorhynchus mykiss TaxID=8022 RepID=A0A060YGH6_ONCMY|nr:unnamed protein product [Oncorhynchus mykiss]
MKVTVTFGATAVVVPCKGEWTVRELVDQANQRYRKILEQNGEDFLVRTHRMEYCDGGILDLDDLLTDLVEDRDKVRPNDVNINIHHENIYVWVEPVSGWTGAG